MSQEAQHLKDEGSQGQVVVAGGLAGLVSRFCVAPLDVLKIRLQLQSHSLSDPLSTRGHPGPTYSGTWNTFKTIVKDEGVTSLWKGNIPAEGLYLLYGACQFTAYRTATRLLHGLPPQRRLPNGVENFVCGASAGGVATSISYPLDLLRTRFAATGTSRVYTGLIASVKDIARDEGPRGFFRGCSAAVGQIVPYMGLFFASYEALKIPLAEYSFGLGSGDAVAGILASVASKTAVFPLDTVRKRLQVQGPTRSRYVHTNIPVYSGIISTLRAILRKERVRGLYRGLPVSLIKAAPASAITMWTYERTLLVLRNTDLDS